MSTVFQQRNEALPQRELPLLHAADPGHVIAWRDGRAVRVGEFLQHVRDVAAVLPSGRHVLNLCEDRYAFLVTFCAVLVAGQTNVLPPSRAPRALAEVMSVHVGCHAVGEQDLADVPARYLRLPPIARAPYAPDIEIPRIPAGHVAAINYTSGSTGRPHPHAKRWGDFHASAVGTRHLFATHGVPGKRHVVATVPPQHMYGLEQSILQPLLGQAGIHAGRPLFPADIAAALARVPAPRLLVTTPVHLRALVADATNLPELAAILSATAPMPADLAAEAEARYGVPLIEVLGSTETCGIAGRRTTQGELWAAYPGVRLHPQPDGTQVEAPQLAKPVVLADLVEIRDERHFCLRGRNTDMVEIAGKRASMADLTRRLLDIPGVADGVVCQLDQADPIGVRRIAALAVAPGLSEAQIVDALRASIDPVFLPRPLRCVPVLPRNESGKLPRRELLALLRGGD